MKTITILASDYAKLDSDVQTGGGTDETAVFQNILDKALETPLRLVMDGAALVGGLSFHSNTTIECLNQTCGFYLADNANRALLQNYNCDLTTINTENINILGGTYNFNCLHQTHNFCPDGHEVTLFKPQDVGLYWVFGFRIYGIRNLLIRDVTTIDQRTFCMCVGNFDNVTMENIDLQLPNNMWAQNQDGLHFFGPGRFLTLRNIKGCAGDDLVSIAPDEIDEVSDITDVVVDGVMARDADQVIRLFSRAAGKLDRVNIRNVTGIYKSFGFFINPWYDDPKLMRGNIGNLTIENVDLVQKNHKYDYSTPVLFRLGGNIEKITLRNIRFLNQTDKAVFLQIGGYYINDANYTESQTTNIGTVFLDNVEVVKNKNDIKTTAMELDGCIENLIINNAFWNDLDESNIVIGKNAKVNNLGGIDADVYRKLLQKAGK